MKQLSTSERLPREETTRPRNNARPTTRTTSTQEGVKGEETRPNSLRLLEVSITIAALDPTSRTPAFPSTVSGFSSISRQRTGAKSPIVRQRRSPDEIVAASALSGIHGMQRFRRVVSQASGKPRKFQSFPDPWLFLLQCCFSPST